MNKKVAFCTLGCKVNHYETEAMAELFQKQGYTVADFGSPADVYVINTCTVTNMSDRKSRQMIRRARKQNPDAFIAVAGCYAQTAPDQVQAIEGVNLVIGTNQRKHIVELVERTPKTAHVSAVKNIMDAHEFEQLDINGYSGQTRAYIKIQEGCNQFCAYCIIPYARGPIRSRPMEDVLAETEKLVGNGFTEVVYVGIHVASYGLDKGAPGLCTLLGRANRIDGLRRIRLSSIEPMTLDQAFIDQIKHCGKLCHHFHLSLQSGCDETLRRMNRHYTTAAYKAIVDGLRENYPDVAVTTDIMVGFPGETEAEFQQTLDFVEQMQFADAHIFQYSPRKGTPAAKMEQLPPQVKEARSKAVLACTGRSHQKFMASFIGKTAEVLFEQPHGDGLFEGKTGNYLTVRAPGTGLSGVYKTVLLEKIEDGAIYGTIRE